MLWKRQSRPRFNQHCDGLSQTVAIRPIADIEKLSTQGRIAGSLKQFEIRQFKAPVVQCLRAAVKAHGR
jgi:hypothetical protein